MSGSLIIENGATILGWGNSLWKSDFYVGKISNSIHLLLCVFEKYPCLCLSALWFVLGMSWINPEPGYRCRK